MPVDAAMALEIASLRQPLRGYLRTLVPEDPAACEDLAQETLLFVWEKRDEGFKAETMKAWVFKIAWFKVLAWRRDNKRSRIVYFSDELLQEIAPVAEELADTTDERLEALRHCLTRLPREKQDLLRLKYAEHANLSEYAKKRNWKPNRVQKTLSRIRQVLRHCIESRLEHKP